MSVVTGISGQYISAKYGPTNSADVSAIASAYQVVSATAGDGTYVTSINGMGISGQGGGGTQVVTSTGSSERLGTSYVSEINGSGISATVARLDSNGRDLGKLIDSASCSAIASSYAESAASGKLDSTAQVVSSTSSGSYITGGWIPAYAVNKINGSGILAVSSTSALSATYANTATRDSTGRLLSSLPDSATVSAIASAYQVVSSVGNDGTYITSINGSALSGVGGGGGTGNYVETSATDVAIGSGNSAANTAFAQGDTNSADGDSFAQGANNKASPYSFAQGDSNSGGFVSFAQGGYNTAYSYSFAQGGYNTADSLSFAQGDSNSAYLCSFAQGENNSAITKSFAHGQGISAINSASIFGQYNLSGDGDTSTGNSAAFAIGDGTDNDNRHDLMLVTKDGEIRTYSSTADTAGFPIRSAIMAVSAAATGGATGDYVPNSALQVTIGSANSSETATSTSDTAAFAQGISNYASGNSFAQGFGNSAVVTGFTQGVVNSASENSFAQGSGNKATQYSFAQGTHNSASSWSVSIGSHCVASSDSMAQGWYCSADDLSLAQGQLVFASSESFAQGFHCSATGNSIAQGSHCSANDGSIAQGYFNSASGNVAAFGQYNLHGNGNTLAGDSAALVIGDGWHDSGNDVDYRHDLMVVTKNAEITMYSGSADTTGTGIMSSIRSLSSVSDLVTSQSANWGGSALQLSAGPGVKLEKSGSVLVASTDETVLWSGFANVTGSAYDLSESMTNFERLKFVCSINSAGHQRGSLVTEYDITLNNTSPRYFYPECRNIAANTITSNIMYVSATDAQWAFLNGIKYVNSTLTTGVGTYDFFLHKIVGVNRTASN